MLVVGLTGGIASGKSTVATRWRSRGIAVIDADVVAREVVERGQPTLAAIVDYFGTHVVDPGGHLNRQKLGQIVFSDETALSALNRITHPAILGRVSESLERLRAEGCPWVVYEAALIVDNQLTPELDMLVVVICDPTLQHTRLMARNNLNAEQAWGRIHAQATNAQRQAHADVVIENDGSVEQLIAAADRVATTCDSRVREHLR